LIFVGGVKIGGKARNGAINATVMSGGFLDTSVAMASPHHNMPPMQFAFQNLLIAIKAYHKVAGLLNLQHMKIRFELSVSS
jgi:hypothetical protein